MAKISFASVLIVVMTMLAAAPLSAHHRWPVDRSALVTVSGTVLSFVWENPHPIITLEVQNDDGATEEWRIGGPALNRMEANGWTDATVKPGDEITGIGYQFRDGQKIVRLERITLPDGSDIRVYERD